jgi:glutamate dehydrogenase (NADP+)
MYPIVDSALISKSAEFILAAVLHRDPHEGEFIQAVQEVVHSLDPVLSKIPQYGHSSLQCIASIITTYI